MKTVLTFVVLSLVFISTQSHANQLSDKIQINGYSSFEFEKLLGDEGQGDPNGSFDADLFDLVLNIQATEKLKIGRAHV